MKHMWKKFKTWVGSGTTDYPIIEFKDQHVTISDKEYLLVRSTIDDIDGLLTVERKVYNGKTPWDTLAFTSEVRKKDNHLFLSILDGYQIIGYVGAWFSLKESHITNIAVLPQYQSLGIGYYLIDLVRQMANEIGSAMVTLEVRVSNEGAIRLYHRLGFEDRNIKQGYYTADHEDALNMCLPLENTQEPSV